MVDAGGVFFFFFGKGPYIILFVTPPPHFSLLSKAPVPTVSTQWPNAVFFEAGSPGIQADREFTM